jgi:hypothetical protein
MNNEKMSIKVIVSGCESSEKRDKFFVMKARQELVSSLKAFKGMLNFHTEENGVIRITSERFTKNKEGSKLLKDVHDKISSHLYRFCLVPSIESYDDSLQNIMLVDDYMFIN